MSKVFVRLGNFIPILQQEFLRKNMLNNLKKLDNKKYNLYKSKHMHNIRLIKSIKG
jgi:hypothetical protein